MHIVSHLEIYGLLVDSMKFGSAILTLKMAVPCYERMSIILICHEDIRSLSVLVMYKGGLINLWLYKENEGLKKFIYSTYSPLSSTHLWLRCSNFFNPSRENSFGSAANRKS
jgi:hypothetical protein